MWFLHLGQTGSSKRKKVRHVPWIYLQNAVLFTYIFCMMQTFQKWRLAYLWDMDVWSSRSIPTYLPPKMVYFPTFYLRNSKLGCVCLRFIFFYFRWDSSAFLSAIIRNIFFGTFSNHPTFANPSRKNIFWKCIINCCIFGLKPTSKKTFFLTTSQQKSSIILSTQ